MVLWHLFITDWNGKEAMPRDEKISGRLKLKDLQTLMAVIEAGGMGKAADRLSPAWSARWEGACSSAGARGSS